MSGPSRPPDPPPPHPPRPPRLRRGPRPRRPAPRPRRSPPRAAAAVALVHLAPRSWGAVLGGVTLAAVVVCAYAVLTKVFPGSLAPNDTYARLEEPYGYWNAIGLVAAMGAIGCVWLGARRTGH